LGVCAEGSLAFALSSYSGFPVFIPFPFSSLVTVFVSANNATVIKKVGEFPHQIVFEKRTEQNKEKGANRIA